MTTEFDDLKAALFAARDGGVACDAINKLAKHAKKGSEQAKKVLADYACNGSINHMREFACSGLAGAVTEADIQFAAVFRRGLSDAHIRYWSILGYIVTAGKGAYEDLAKIVADKSIPAGDRGHAVKCLATFSKQLFDRHLPSDPGHWKEKDLRLSEVAAWAKGGFPDGQGYSLPTRHAALDEPRTAIEMVVSRLDKKLAKVARQPRRGGRPRTPEESNRWSRPRPPLPQS